MKSEWVGQQDRFRKVKIDGKRTQTQRHNRRRRTQNANAHASTQSKEEKEKVIILGGEGETLYTAGYP